MISLERIDGRVLRIAHRGAPVLAPENTLPSFAAALDHGMDIVELDVLALPDGRIAVTHDRPARGAEILLLDDALGFLADREARVQVDLKLRDPAGVVEAVRRHGLVEHAFVSGADAAALRRVRELEPGLRTSFTYPEDRFGLTKRGGLNALTTPGLAVMQRALPARVGGMLARAGATAMTLHHAVVTAAVVERCTALGAPVLAWTVDDPAVCRRLEALGVAGIITNDPRVFPSET
ncbi:MAG TPA: glycerophosphodiester phosphodiesterase [Gaiellaceae bacterium]|nr:glycerophosphodiester phosphodiesterase [Gaiellaceae bacterium]